MRNLLIVFTFLSMTSIHAGQALDACCRLASSRSAGKATELQITMTNLQDQPVLVYQTTSEWDLRVQIREVNGRQVPLTDYGRRMATQLRSGSLKKHTLARGEQFTQSLDLSKLYEL